MKARTRVALLTGTACLVSVSIAAPSSSPVHAAPGCSVSYLVSNAWPGGFQGSIRVTNTGDAWASWSLRFTFPSGRSATQGWGGVWTTGASPVVTNASWNAAVPTGGSVGLGFIGSGTADGSAPASFSVNGTSCTGGSTTAVTTTRSTTTTSRSTTTTTRGTTTTTRPSTTTTTGAGTGTPVERWGQLRVCGTRMCDRNNSPVQLRGVSSMWLNWETNGYAENLTQLRWMRDTWGLTVIRAAMGVEPTGAYLSDPVKARTQVETIINNAVAAGVYVIVDWHAHEANTNQAQAVAFFTDMASRYGNLPNVIWEPWNEPLQVSWTDVIKPYHQAVVSAIRARDPDNIIVLGTPRWSQTVDEVAVSPVPGTNLMYTLHFYSCSHPEWLRTRGDKAISAGLALFVTEWGATNADGGLDGQVCLTEAQLWIDWMRTNGVSWAAWKLDDCNDSSCLLNPGTPLTANWDGYLHGHAPFVRTAIRG